jgi:DNA mismatch repair protein MutS2
MSTETSLELNVIIAQIETYCAFSLGKKRIEETEPSYDHLVIRRDLELGREALAATVHYGPMPFAGIRDLTAMLENASKGRTLTAQDLLNEMHLIAGMRGIHEYEKTLVDLDHPSLHELIDSITVHTHTETLLKKCINAYGEVMDSASPALKGIRSSLRSIQGEIASAAQRFVSQHSDSVVDSIVTDRGGRAVILVKAAEKNTFGGMVYGDSASGQASYVEPAALVGLNNRRQQLEEAEREEVQRILVELSKEVRAIAKEELANLDTCALLDAFFAKAQWGQAHEAVTASLTEERKICLSKARHPLIDPKKVVANTYSLGEPKHVLLITGPNTGGKTVSMKILGLFVLMTYCGIPVPCEEAEIPYFDHVFADIGDDQSVVSSLSSFSAHISKQAEILNHATKDSLVLLDEVGSGTDPKEGEALAIAILNQLRDLGCMTVCTTHYDRLKAYGKRHEDILLAGVAFDMKKLAPTYRYTEGITGQSNAFEVAARYGLPSSVIKYARFLKNQAKTEEDTLIERLEKQLNENENKGIELQKQLEDAKQRTSELKKERSALEKEKDTFRLKAEAEAEQYLEKVRKEADAILKDIRKRRDTSRYHEVVAERGKLNDLSAPEEVEEEEVPQNIEYHVGDAVELRNSAADYVCEVLKVGRKEILISMNGREMRVKKNQIRPSRHIIAHVKPQATVSVQGDNIFASIPSEVNLIGMRVDEGITRMEDYMDQAKVHGLKTFRIIHGDGSGRLRKAVQERLKRDPDVKKFRLGMPQEGGTGATVVTMK